MSGSEELSIDTKLHQLRRRSGELPISRLSAFVDFDRYMKETKLRLEDNAKKQIEKLSQIKCGSVENVQKSSVEAEFKSDEVQIVNVRQERRHWGKYMVAVAVLMMLLAIFILVLHYAHASSQPDFSDLQSVRARQCSSYLSSIRTPVEQPQPHSPNVKKPTNKFKLFGTPKKITKKHTVR